MSDDKPIIVSIKNAELANELTPVEALSYYLYHGVPLVINGDPDAS
jgi:hypothetical protein